MNDTKNESVVELAKNFIDDCNNFEIKNLDSAELEQSNLPDISLFSDLVKEYLNPIEEEQNQNLIKTGNKDLDELCIFEKGKFKLFCTDEFDVPLARMVNSFVIEAVAGGKRVLIISPCPNVIVRNFLKAIIRKDHQNNLSWFDDKKLYFCECMTDENIIDFTENIKSKIFDLNIDIVYIPFLEDFFSFYCAELQIKTLNHLYEYAFKMQICVVSTIASYDYDKIFCDDETQLFHTQYKLSYTALIYQLQTDTCYCVSFSDCFAKFENWGVWDYVNDSPKEVAVQSSDGFYTFDSMTKDYMFLD